MPAVSKTIDTADTHAMMIKTISEIVSHLIAAYDRGE